jgi:hypothetical protein
MASTVMNTGHKEFSNFPKLFCASPLNGVKLEWKNRALGH